MQKLWKNKIFLNIAPNFQFGAVFFYKNSEFSNIPESKTYETIAIFAK